jgi:hypothetical protein
VKAHHPLLKAWNRFSPRKGSNILNGDEKLLEPYKGRSLVHQYSSFDSYIADPNFSQPEKAHMLHLGLIPVPFVGNLQSAKVFILMLNPGFSEVDYYSETHCSDFRSALVDSLRQRIHPNDFPMISLNPRFAWTGGYRYWSAKLDKVLMAACKHRRFSWTDALRFVSRNLACIELYPYHSRSFHLPASVKNSLLSAKLAKTYVHDVLVPKARSGAATIIVTRKGSEWDLPHHRNIVVYNSSESRAAHLTLNTSGGRKISEFLNLPVS